MKTILLTKLFKNKKINTLLLRVYFYLIKQQNKMKKLVLVLLLVTAGAVNAQFVELGIKGGVNFSSIDGSGSIDFDTRTGYHFGAVLEVGLLGSWALQPEVIFSSQGAKVRNNDIFNEFDLKYVNVPVMLKYYLLSDRLNLEVGPQFGFLTDDNLNDVIDTKSFDFALAGGVGVNLTSRIFVQARYIAGMSEFSKEAKLRNNNVQISVGLKF